MAPAKKKKTLKEAVKKKIDKKIKKRAGDYQDKNNPSQKIFLPLQEFTGPSRFKEINQEYTGPSRFKESNNDPIASPDNARSNKRPIKNKSKKPPKQKSLENLIHNAVTRELKKIKKLGGEFELL